MPNSKRPMYVTSRILIVDGEWKVEILSVDEDPSFGKFLLELERTYIINSDVKKLEDYGNAIKIEFTDGCVEFVSCNQETRPVAD